MKRYEIRETFVSTIKVWEKFKKGVIVAGVLLIVIGGIFLLQNMGIITGDVWGIIWPSVLIVLGLWMITKVKPPTNIE